MPAARLENVLIRRLRAALWAPSSVEAILLVCFLSMQLAHVVELAFPHPKLGSNLIQTALDFLPALLCAYKAYTAKEAQYRRRWIQAFVAFLLYLTAQCVFLRDVLTHAPQQAFLLSDDIFLFFALPLLLIASTRPHRAGRDLVGLLDTGQTCLFFIIVFALVYSTPDRVNLSRAYNIQGLALSLAFVIRYSTSHAGEERIFFRNLTIFTTLYSVCSAIGSSPACARLLGHSIDLCWSVPITTFGYLMICRSSDAGTRVPWAARVLAPTHFHGISALSLALMGLTGSAVLIRHRPLPGSLMLAASFLLFAFRTSIREWQLQTAHAQLEHSVLHDSLTGLANRKLLKQELTTALQSLEPSSPRRISLLFVDLDRFKTINDALGHAFGDALLIRVANLLRSAARPNDLVARLGGDEFVIMLTQVDGKEAEAVAERIIQTLREPIMLGGSKVQVTASIGIVLSSEYSTGESMLQDADCAMYEAKRSGKDRAQIFVPDMLTAAKRRLEIQIGLRQALAGKGIQIHYQPIFGLPEVSVRGFEALARWRHPVLGTISPAEFIPVAEETGLIVELGRKVLEEACCQCRAWNQQMGAQLRITVNVSAHQLSQPDFLKTVERIVRGSKLDPSLLRLEVTESVMLSGQRAVEEVLTNIRKLGIGICLDDFGTGYSSLSYLLRFPFDIVKIDRSFVRHLDADYQRTAMVRMIVQLARTLNKKVIAEGVESQAELALLKELQCDMVQGFLLSHPLPVDEVEKLFATGVKLRGGAGLTIRSPRKARSPYAHHTPSPYSRI